MNKNDEDFFYEEDFYGIEEACNKFLISVYSAGLITAIIVILIILFVYN